MYLVIKPYDKDSCCHPRPLSHNRNAYITVALTEVAEALNTEGTRVYKLDTLTQVTSVNLTEVTAETANG